MSDMRVIIPARINPPPTLELVQRLLAGELDVEFRFIVTLYGVDVECASLEDAKRLIQTFWRSESTTATDAVGQRVEEPHLTTREGV